MCACIVLPQELVRKKLESAAKDQGISDEPPLMRIMKRPAKAMKKDSKKSTMLKVRAWRAKQAEKKNVRFLQNINAQMKRALDDGRVYAPRPKSAARLLQLTTTAIFLAKDAKKVSLEAKAESKQARIMAEETAAAQTQLVINHDTRLNIIEEVLKIGGDKEDSESIITSPGPRWVGDGEKGTPPYTKPSQRRKLNGVEDKMVNGCQHHKESLSKFEQVRQGTVAWNEGRPESDK